MNSGTVLVTDPIDGDVSIIAQKLMSLGFATLSPSPNQSWLELAEHADGLIVNLDVVDPNALAKLTRCKIITRLGVGINNIDIAAAKARSIVVTNVPDYCRHEVSEHALGLMLALVRKLVQASADVQRGHWHQLGYRPVRRLHGMTLGLVGFGRIAQSLANKAMGLGMRVVTSDPYVPGHVEPSVQRLTLNELFLHADIVSLHVPLVPETRGMIGRESLERMKAGVILINTSRGELIDESALAKALDSKHLAGAGLDVLCAEPLPRESPLRDRANVIITPHMAFYSEDSLVSLQITAAEDVARFLSGQEPKFRAA
jgi:D-3-phosphoglycerate dehydrogenase / 2-oxoglutarate reductase